MTDDQLQLLYQESVRCDVWPEDIPHIGLVKMTIGRVVLTFVRQENGKWQTAYEAYTVPVE